MASLLLLWFAPAILSSRLCWPRVVAYLTSDLDARISTDGAALGWLSPVILRNVSVEESEGKQVASIETLRTEKSLLSLLWSGGDFGAIHIEHPQLTLRLHEHGSNVEDILTPLLSQTGSSGGSCGTIELSAGKLVVFDEQNKAIARLDAIEAVVTQSGAAVEQGQEESGVGGGVVALKRCRVTTDKGTGSLAGSLSWQPKAKSTDWSLATVAEAFDLSVLQPLARRWGVAIDVQGSLHLDAKAAWESASSRWTIELKQADATALRLMAPAWLGQDQLALGPIPGSRHVRICSRHLACDQRRASM